MTQDKLTLFKPFWEILDEPDTTRKLEAILMLDMRTEDFFLELFFSDFVLFLETAKMTPAKQGCLIGAYGDKLVLSIGLDDDVCEGADWKELAANLPEGLKQYPNLTPDNFGWVQEVLNTVARTPSTLRITRV